VLYICIVSLSKRRQAKMAIEVKTSVQTVRLIILLVTPTSRTCGWSDRRLSNSVPGHEGTADAAKIWFDRSCLPLICGRIVDFDVTFCLRGPELGLKLGHGCADLSWRAMHAILPVEINAGGSGWFRPKEPRCGMCRRRDRL